MQIAVKIRSANTSLDSTSSTALTTITGILEPAPAEAACSECDEYNEDSDNEPQDGGDEFGVYSRKGDNGSSSWTRNLPAECVRAEIAVAMGMEDCEVLILSFPPCHLLPLSRLAFPHPH
jgi:hypothetical protein